MPVCGSLNYSMHQCITMPNSSLNNYDFCKITYITQIDNFVI